MLDKQTKGSIMQRYLDVFLIILLFLSLDAIKAFSGNVIQVIQC